jgi:NAD(P)-dependent dehydrogenase (short-subunit alcohol dehydrogenase family)
MSGHTASNGNTRKLEGKVALVSGGAQGIGRAIAACFQREGAGIVLLDCDVPAARCAAEALTRERPSLPVAFIEADLNDADQICDAVRALKERHQRLDILVNNAGIEPDKPIAELALCEWDRVININLRAAFLLTQLCLPLFPESGGCVVNISSIHATHAFPNSVPYACSKAGLVALTRNMALELAPRKIRVNTISPGYIDTRLWEEYLRSSSNPEALAAQTAALHPVGRRGVPEDIGEAALFLASPAASFITGANLVVDGGITIRAHN